MHISVVIPTFNRAALLERCLRSLVKSGISNLEIIVVDDGGTDNTAAVVARFPGVVYKRQPNAGPAAARNFGFACSRGRYIGFIDSDDEWIDGGARRLTAELEGNPDLWVIFADTLMGNDSTGFVSFIETYGRKEFFDLPHEKRSGVRVFDRRPLLLQLSTRNVMFLGSMVFRREAFEMLGGFERCGAEDWEIFMRAVVNGRVGFSEGPALSRYYKHDGALTMDSDKMERDFISALESVRRLCDLDSVERRHIDRRIRDHVFWWAFSAYDAGDLRLARRRLYLAHRLRQMGSREFVYLMATYFPTPVVTALRRARHALGV